ncbi:hypothetical protein Tco_0680766 [Tanacetum coccineum]|uniref:Uncharacterized protein n=1 Tax=Tanacetum coccineum TaxID=301880 RepID=A0ABQ4XMA3_9ASTR
MLEDFSSNSKGKRTYAYTILFRELKTLNLSCLLKEQPLEPALNLTVHCCGLEFRVLNGYDQKSFDEEPMAEVQMTADDNVSATGQQHTKQPEFINEGEVDQNAEQCHDICPLPAKLTDNMTTELSNQSLESENVCLKKDCSQSAANLARKIIVFRQLIHWPLSRINLIHGFFY